MRWATRRPPGQIQLSSPRGPKPGATDGNLPFAAATKGFDPSETRSGRAATAPPRAGVAIDNLRAVVVLFVLLFHSVLAYLNFLPPQPYPFDGPPYLWRTIPIVDHARWFGFDLFCAWLDV